MATVGEIVNYCGCRLNDSTISSVRFHNGHFDEDVLSSVSLHCRSLFLGLGGDSYLNHPFYFPEPRMANQLALDRCRHLRLVKAKQPSA